MCDDIVDCTDGADESSCPCKEDEFACKTGGMCIKKEFRCDSDSDCIDHSDEKDCSECILCLVSSLLIRVVAKNSCGETRLKGFDVGHNFFKSYEYNQISYV